MYTFSRLYTMQFVPNYQGILLLNEAPTPDPHHKKK